MRSRGRTNGGLAQPRSIAMILGLILSVLSGARAGADTGAAIGAYQRGDYATALRELEEAAKAGDAQAYYNLGVVYNDGKAVPRNLETAAEMFRRGAEKGSVLAAFALAQAYRRGEGVAVDYGQAAHWYAFAAKRGDFRAGNELGILYIEGKGVRKDPVEGFAWIYTGTHADILDDQALANAFQLVPMLTREQLREGQERGRRYHQRYIKPHPEVVRTLLER